MRGYAGERLPRAVHDVGGVPSGRCGARVGVAWRRSSWACGYAFREFGADQWKMTDRNFRRSPAAPVCGRNVYSSPEQSAFLKTIATLSVRFLGE